MRNIYALFLPGATRLRPEVDLPVDRERCGGKCFILFFWHRFSGHYRDISAPGSQARNTCQDQLLLGHLFPPGPQGHTLCIPDMPGLLTFFDLRCKDHHLTLISHLSPGDF